MIGLIKDRVAVRMIQDADFTTGKPQYTPAEIAYLESTGGFNSSPVALEIPVIAKENADQGIVKYVGPDVKDIKVGDYVLFGGYDGAVIVLEGEGMLLLISEDYIKATIVNINTDISGLYFKAKITKEEEEERTQEIIHAIDWADTSTTKDMRRVVKDIVKIFNKRDPYFVATHEMAVELISRSWDDHPLNIRTKDKLDNRSKSQSGEL